MEHIKINYSQKLERELLQYDVPFTVDYNESDAPSIITIEVNLRQLPRHGRATMLKLIPAIAPLLSELSDRPLVVYDHLQEDSALQLVNEHFLISCGGFRGTGGVEGERKTYEELKYKKEIIKNEASQCEMVYFKPEYGVEIKDDEDQPIAFLSANRIHFFFDIFHTGSLKQLHVKLIRDAVTLYREIEHELIGIFEEYKTIFAKRKFAEMLKERESRKARALESSIQRFKEQISLTERTLYNNLTSLREASVELEALQNSNKNEEEFEKEAEQLIDEYKVEVNDTGFKFKTEEIWIGSAKLGQFQISVNIHEGRLQIDNLTRKYGRFDHPHIADGQMCFGNLNNEIIRLLSEGKYLEVAAFAKECLYFLNEGGQHVNINRWIDS